MKREGETIKVHLSLCYSAVIAAIPQFPVNRTHGL